MTGIEPDFDSMNETDVREAVVRPMLCLLGYRHGTEATIRCEVPLRYDRAFLGRKSKTDPLLRGRADYICEVVSYGRWAVEVKGPNQPLTREDAEQAHTYSAHPEIQATHFVVTNGRRFVLYATGQLDTPILDWEFGEFDRHYMTLMNILGPEAVKRRAKLVRYDADKPLGLHLPSSVRLAYGEVVYGEHRSDHPMLSGNAMSGMKGTITGGWLQRGDDGRLHAQISHRGPIPQVEPINEMLGISPLDFFSTDEFVSRDSESPTIFQNSKSFNLPPGFKYAPVIGGPELISPIGFICNMYCDAIGFMSDDEFVGTVSFIYEYVFRTGYVLPEMAHIVRQMPKEARMEGEAIFNVGWKPSN